MSDDAKNEARSGSDSGKAADLYTPQGRLRNLLQLPSLAAISLYMMVLAGINVLGVAAGQTPPAFLVFSALFIAAGLGLLLVLRWAWALTLAAVVLLVAMFLWKFAASHDFPVAVQGLLNLVFFLYLVRIEVREKLR
jgi:signal transduction histidine kinase